MSDVSFNMAKAACPRCGYVLDAASPMRDDHQANIRPKAGDVSICLRCGKILVFDFECQPVSALPSDLIRVDPQDLAELRRMSRLAPVFWAKHKRGN